MFLEETFEWLGTDNPHVKQSFGIAASIVGYLHFNKNYLQEVRDWAGRTERNARETQEWTLLRSVVRKWYRANEAYLRSEQYEKVKPGEEIPPLPSSDPPGRRVMTFPPNAEPKASPTPVNPAALPAIVREERNHSEPRYLFLAAGFTVIATLIALAFLWHRRRTHKERK